MEMSGNGKKDINLKKGEYEVSCVGVAHTLQHDLWIVTRAQHWGLCPGRASAHRTVRCLVSGSVQDWGEIATGKTEW